MSARLARYHDGSGYRAALVLEGRRGGAIAVTIDDGGVRAERLGPGELQYLTPLEGSVKTAARRMRGAGRSLGISKTARRLLRGL